MVTVFDLVTGETETFSGRKQAPAQAPIRTPAQTAPPQVLPRLQEHEFAQPPQATDPQWAVAHLDVELFIRAMEND